MGYKRGERGLGRRHTLTAARELLGAKGGLRIETRYVYAEECPAHEVLQEFFEPRDPHYYPMLPYYEVIGEKELSPVMNADAMQTAEEMQIRGNA